MKTKSLIGVLPLLAVASQAMATPTLYPTSLNVLSTLKNPTTSNLIADDTDVNKVYVMPPNEGYGYAAGLHTLSASLLFCPSLKQLASQSEKIGAKIESLRLQMGDELKTLKELDVQIEAAQEEAAQYATENHLQDLQKIDTEINQVTTSLDANTAALDTCKQNCEALTNEIKIETDDLSSLTKTRAAFVKAHLSAMPMYDRKKAKVAALTEQKTNLLDDYQTVTNKLTQAQMQIASLFTTYGAMEGGRASFKYRSGWNDNIATLRSLNPTMNFASIDTENVKIYPGVLGVVGLPATGAVIGFEMPGSASSKDGSISMPSYPPSIDGNVVLSLLGACPMVQPDLFTFSADTSPTNMKYGMLISYDYPSTMLLKMKATYNMHKMYQLIRESGSSGGFFSSHSWTSTEERMYFHDAFRVDWTSQDPANTISDDQRLNMEREARTHLFQRLFSLALPMAPDKSLLVTAVPPPAHGSVVVADSLISACPGNVYCVGGSLVLRALDSIFGSSSSTSTYTQVQDVDMEEEWSQSKVVMKPWITNYRMN